MPILYGHRPATRLHDGDSCAMNPLLPWADGVRPQAGLGPKAALGPVATGALDDQGVHRAINLAPSC